MDTGLRDRVVIVAGASQGIGRAAADAFAREGARLAICSRDLHRIRAAAEEIAAQHKVNVFAATVDVTNAEAVRNFVGTVAERFGRIDVCVCNAGGPRAAPFLDLTLDDWQRAFELNLMSVVHFAREVLPHMRARRWGRIITITSLSARQPIPGLVLSNSIRTGVAGLVRTLASEFGRDGITVNNVGPGYTATERLKEFAASVGSRSGQTEDQLFAEWASDTAVGRIAQPEEVADAIVWLASGRAAMVTGQTILVDGGAYKGL